MRLIAPSIGIVRCDEAGLTLDELIRRADVAMYTAKRGKLATASTNRVWKNARTKPFGAARRTMRERMRIPDFELEVFFGKHEFSAPHLLAQSDCEALSIAELLALEPDPAGAREAFLQTRLGYAEMTANRNSGRP